MGPALKTLSISKVVNEARATFDPAPEGGPVEDVADKGPLRRTLLDATKPGTGGKLPDTTMVSPCALIRLPSNRTIVFEEVTCADKPSDLPE